MGSKISQLLGEDGPRQVVTKGQFKLDNVLYPGFVTHDSLERVKKFAFKPDDVCIVTHPKAGTTWVGEIVDFILCEGNFEDVRSKSMLQRHCFMEVNTPHGPLLDIFQHPGSHRIFRTHLNASFFDHALKTEDCPKFIFVTRNIKDSLVSFYHFSRMNKKMGSFPGTWNDWFETFKLGRLYYGDWYDYNLGWWKACKHDSDHVLHVSYEDLQHNHRKNVEKIAHFLGKELSAEEIDRIVEATTFREMKEKSNFNLGPDADESISPFMRQGKAGDWKNHFTTCQSRYVDKMHAKRMRGSDLKIEFE